MSEKEKYEQARRVLLILRFFEQKKELTTAQVLDLINNRFGGISERSIQRDLQILKEEDLIEQTGRGNESIWKLRTNSLIKTSPANLSGDEMLSFYMLKAYLSTFKGTSIESELSKLTKKIEKLAPGDVFLENTLYWDQNPGSYDYSLKPNLISKLIRYIVDKQWIKIRYQRMFDDTEHDYEVLPCSLYTYAGVIYLVAYNSYSKSHFNFVIHNIQDIEESLKSQKVVPEFDYEEFRKQRFGVIGGGIEKVRILIKKEFVKYFENRFWHSSQKMIMQKDDTMILTMKVPVTPELAGWVCRWNEALTVIEPTDLKEWVIGLLKLSLKNYE